MAPMYIRGGLPQHFNETAKAGTVEGWNVDRAVANYLWLKNVGANTIRLTLTTKEEASAKWITIASGETWEGPAEIGCFYVQAVTGDSDFEAVAYRVRG